MIILQNLITCMLKHLPSRLWRSPQRELTRLTPGWVRLSRSLGVCNGCQLMALLGWVPGTGGGSDGPLLPSEQQPRFLHNESGRCVWCPVCCPRLKTYSAQKQQLLQLRASHMLRSAKFRFSQPGARVTSVCDCILC